MRKCIVNSVRILTVFVLVAGLPLMALPPVRSHVSDWMQDAFEGKRLNLNFAELGLTGRRSSAVKTVEEAETQWQAEPIVNSSDKAQIQEIRQNLVRLGAKDIRLAEVSGHPAEFHFSCSMPLDDRAVYSRKFAITDSDPIRAMTRALDEVERWRESHSNL